MPQDYESKYDMTLSDIDGQLEERVSDYMIADDTGRPTRDVTTHTRKHYMGALAEREVDPRSGMDHESADRALGMTFGFAEGEMPELNGMPVVPFDRGMSQRKIERVWKALTPEDFQKMNNGGVPTAEGLDGKLISPEALKQGVLLYRDPGVYQMAVVINGELQVVIDAETKLPYEMNYPMIEEQMNIRLEED